MRKKILATLLVMALLLPVLGLAQAGAEETPLQFGADGKLRILQLADLQDGLKLDIRVKRFLQTLLQTDDPAKKPDLVALTGDNIQGAIAGTFALTQDMKDKAVQEAIDEFMPILNRAGVPIAVVFGNHDTEGSMYIGFGTSKEKQLAWYQKYENCVMIDQDPAYENQDLSGTGNYNLPVLSSDGTRTAYNLWFFDAFNSGSTKPYDGVHDDVLDWYTWKSDQLKEANGGAWVPAISFQHVIVPEIGAAMEAAGRKVDTGIPVSTNDYIWEDPCPNDNTNANQFGRMQGRDLKAMFFGHDHNNNFRIPYQGVDLICTGGSCFGDRGLQMFFAYNRTHDALARLITLDENNPGVIVTETLRYSDYEKAGLLQELDFNAPLSALESLELFFANVLAAILKQFDKLLIKINLF
ncbi:MAG: metallophosphoesterase [Oscillospiraceae bacterium]|jgi:hypothetical protein|nr:metallophosphoesterase [Oscillospiraceae bacterium]